MKKYLTRTWFSLFLLLVAASLCLAMGGKPLGPDEVSTITKISIADREVVSRNRPLIVSFTDAMVAENQVDKPVAEKDMPFTISPAVEGEGRWITDKSFSFVTTNGYPRGKKYFVLFKDDLRSLDGKPVRYYFSFNTESSTVRAVWQRAYREDTNELPLVISFNLPVKAEALRDHLTVTDAGSGDQLEFELGNLARDASEHELTIRMGQFRPKLLLTMVTDGDKDPNPLGFSQEYVYNLNVPVPGTQAGSSSSSAGSGTTTARSNQDSPVHISNSYSSDYGAEGMRAYFSLTHGLAHDQDLHQFIRVTPELPYELNSDNSYVTFRENVKPGMTINLKLLPGLVDSSGRVLKESRSSTLKVQDMRSSIRFSDGGNYLTPAYGSRIGLDLVNVDRVTVSLNRQYDNNLPFMNLSYYEGKNLSRSVAHRQIDLDLEKNETVHRALDLADLTKGQKGVFLLDVTGYERIDRRDGSHYYSYQTSNNKIVVLTDIGITARQFPAGITVFASSLSTGKPVPGAAVRVYSSSNQLLAEGRTGQNGLFILKRDSVWDPQLTPNVVTVESGDDISFLPMSWQTHFSTNSSATMAYLESGYEAFLYTPRGVFRPGETVDVKAFVRDKDHQPPTPFPVIFSITSSRNLEIARGTDKLSSEGGAAFSFTLPTSAPTGEYTAALTIPGQEGSRLGLVRFQVEDFVPPRLEVEVSPAFDRLVGDDVLKIDLSGQYLFGAPGAGLSYELGYRFNSRMFSPQGWDGFIFGNMERDYQSSVDLRHVQSSLDDQGLAEIDFRAPRWLPPSIGSVQVIGSVQEDGGRWVTQTANFTYFPTSYLLGVKVDGELLPNKPGTIRFAAVDPDGQAAETGPASIEISQIQGSWHTVYRDGRYTYSWSERLDLILSDTVEMVDGQAEVSFTPPRYGRYLIRCSTDEGAVVGARRISVWGYGGEFADDGGGRMDLVELSLDKKDYLPGDVAKLSVKAPYAGTLLLGVERAEQVSVQVISMEKPAAVLDIPVTGDMDPNVTVTAWVYRPVQEENKEWYAHRAYGSIALIMSREPHTLSVIPETPERAMPDQGLSIPFQVLDSEGRPVAGEFSVALVDEGILSLTAFSTPDPVAFFMQQRATVGRTYDGFDALLRPEARATALLLPGGDADAEDYQGSLSTEQIFLAEFIPTIFTDASGRGKAYFDIPEYSGKGRLMIVGASGNRFASGSEQIRFARDIVVEAAAPRAVAPGDSFDLSVKAFAMDPSMEGQAEITVEAEGPLTLTGDLEVSLPLQGGPDGKPLTHMLDIQAVAQNASGVAGISVNVKVPGRDDLTFTKYIEVVVRPPFPRTSQVTTALIRGGDKETLSFDGKWVKGTVKTSISVTGSPVFAVLPALEFLREYPYGCLEQTVSRAWPYLTLTDVLDSLYPEDSAQNNTNQILRGMVARITSMQNAEGGFGMWPGYTVSNPWKSINATFLLVEAKSRVPVQAASLNRALGYLRFLIAAPNSYYWGEADANTTKAYAAFVLTRAGEPPLAWMQQLSGVEKNMYPSGRIFLAAAKALHAGNADALRALKQSDLKFDPAGVGYNYSLESEMRNQAILLMAWSLVAPKDRETDGLCLVLADTINKKRWMNTQEAGMASMAFGYYLGQNKMTDKPHTAVLTAAGQTIGRVQEGEPLLLGHGRMPLDPDGNPEPITVEVGGEGQAYVTYNARGVTFDPPKAGRNELEMQYEWYDPSGRKISFTDAQASLKRGDRITARLDIRTSRTLNDVVVSILLPGGLEVENPRLQGSASSANDPGQRHEGRQDQREYYDEYDDEYGYDYHDSYTPRYGNGMYMDLREDRLLLFYDSIYQGSNWTTYTFSMRAVSRGTFTVPPGAVEGMYDPQSYAVTETRRVVIE